MLTSGHPNVECEAYADGDVYECIHMMLVRT